MIISSRLYISLFTILFVSVALSTPYEITFTSADDFSSGELHNIIVTPDPFFPDGALMLTEFDTIRVLQVFPAGHCADCIDRTVDSLAPFGTPPLNFDIEITTIDNWNDIDSLTDPFDAADPITLSIFDRILTEYDIVFFGIANGYGGADNDLDGSGKRMVREFAGLGRGIVLTHDTIAKREGMFGSHTIGTFVHENFNDIDDVTGLDAEWVSSSAPAHLYYNVDRHPSAPAGATIMESPFDLPSTFNITACHEFGEHYAAGQIWFEGPDDEIYMHTYFSPDYGSYASYFSTGHAEEYDGDSFRPLPWEGKAMINAMFYAYFGGYGSGVYTSPIFSAPCPGGLEEMVCWIDTTGGATVTIELCSSTDGIAWGGWHIIEPETPIPAIVAEGPFYRYRVFMTRSTTGDSPVLHSITWYFDLLTPKLELIEPEIAGFSSCSCGVVSWNVHSETAIDLASASIDLNSVHYGPSRCAYNPIDSVFEFLGPAECWEHGVTYYGLVEILDGETGCPRSGDTTFVFTADFRPPTITNLDPPPGSIISDDTPIIAVVVHDSVSGERNCLFKWIIEGDTVAWGDPGLSWNGTTGRLSLTTSILAFSLSGPVEVCVVAGDRADGCGANMADTCWSFYIDNIGPTAEMISPPTGFLSCDSLRAAFVLYDTMVVDSSSIIISVGSDTIAFPNGMAFSAGTLTIFPDIPVADGDTIIVRFEQITDMLGNNGGPIDFEIIVDRSPPIIWDRIPPDGGYVGLAAPTISMRIGDDISGIDEDSIVVNIDGVDYTIADGSWDGELLTLDGSALGWDFEHDDSIAICIRATDNASGCGPNVLEECWFFWVNLLGPQCYIVGPTDGMIVGCDSFDIIFIIDDPNGVDPASIGFTVNGTAYSVASPEVELHGDTAFFLATVPWSHDDVVEMHITDADDSLGNALESPCEWSFTVDLIAPDILDLDPTPGGVVDTAQPPISAIISDASGVLKSTVTICAAGDCWDLSDSPPGLTMNGDTLTFDPVAAGYFFDEESVFVTISACDSTEWCGPNCSDTSWFFWIDKLGPHAWLVEPDSGVFSSCSTQGFSARLFDPSGIVMDSVELSVNGIPIRWPDAALQYIDDTLIYTPPVPWNHLDTVLFELYFALDSLGNPLQDTIITGVVIDLMPPLVEPVSPLPGSGDALPMDTVSTVITDDGCGIDLDALEFYASGELIPIGSQLALTGDTLVFTPIDFHFAECETAHIQVIASDCAQFCGENSIDTSWSFYVPDDDTLGPIWIDYYPTVWIEDSVFVLTCRAFDSSGIYGAPASDPQAPFIRWDFDGEIDLSCDTIYLDLISIDADTATFEATTPLVSTGEEIVFRASCWDDDFDFSIAEDRTRSDSPLWTISVLEPANIELTWPVFGMVTSCRDQQLRFSITGESSLNMETCIFEIAGDIFALSDSELDVESDSVFVFTPSGDYFFEGQAIVRLVAASDELGNPLHTPVEWIFYVDISPPVISPTSPQNGSMVDYENSNCALNIFDLIAGVDTGSIILTILNDPDSASFTLDSPGMEWDSASGRIEFSPIVAGFHIEEGDSLYYTVCVGDMPDICSPNRGCLSFMYWIEPELECSTSTDPFTPNLDGYNDEVSLFWPGFYRDGAEIEIFDMRGIPIRVINAPPGKPEVGAWDGKNDNGRECPGGVYIYIVKVDGKRICSGTITLAR